MASRPRRSAATRANETISVHARWANSPDRDERGANMSSRRSGRTSGASVSRDPPSPGDSHLNLTVKVNSSKLRQITRGGNRRSESFEGGEIVAGKRNRGAKKNYVVDSSPDDDEDEGDEAEIDEDDEDDEEGEDEMEVDADGEDIDAEGEEDAEGDMDVDMTPIAPTIKVSKPPRSKPLPRPSASKIIQDDEDDDDDDDDDDLSDPADSDEDQTMGFGDDTMADEDAEGEEIEVAGEEEDDDEEEDEEETIEPRVIARGPADSDDDLGSQDGELDLTKMTKRQRARFEDEPQQYMKLSDEVQVKKHFTAEELSMRRQEMARRRRNLSEKRNEEVKMETINKLLKKQAPKVNKKSAAGGANDLMEDGVTRLDTMFVRWVSNKNGVKMAVPVGMLDSPAGQVFGGPGSRPAPDKMVEEVA